ncbi:hypothetical protein [Flavobacterium kingsejongi]|uniref:Uncharacterized protein n=1 Tax=Flavobacterium kingsejongi TaxID=1678728 RepID=A0A2S1LQF0_9FLAO|nr:hypothetical protein [Flavobacterium kingsejongi]AWG25902.1 hypothetical protein FK004_12055 [Flavobacterium kingsejongi]
MAQEPLFLDNATGTVGNVTRSKENVTRDVEGVAILIAFEGIIVPKKPDRTAKILILCSL